MWFSIVLRPTNPATSVSLLQFLAANATRQAVETITGLKAQVKWPNDLVLETGKLGGILVEAKTLGDKIPFAVVGIGLNVNQKRELLPPGATSLRIASGAEYDIRRLLRSIVEEARTRYGDLEEPTRIIEEWWHYCIHRPRLIQVELPKGSIRGISRGVDPEGNLLVETENHKTEKVSEGTLRVLND